MTEKAWRCVCVTVKGKGPKPLLALLLLKHSARLEQGLGSPPFLPSFPGSPLHFCSEKKAAGGELRRPGGLGLGGGSISGRWVLAISTGKQPDSDGKGRSPHCSSPPAHPWLWLLCLLHTPTCAAMLDVCPAHFKCFYPGWTQPLWAAHHPLGGAWCATSCHRVLCAVNDIK